MDKNLAFQLSQFQSGECRRAYTILGCHKAEQDGKSGYLFRVWAPNAKSVSVVGDFNFWNQEDLLSYDHDRVRRLGGFFSICPGRSGVQIRPSPPRTATPS